jgi:protein SCO1/2
MKKRTGIEGNTELCGKISLSVAVMCVLLLVVFAACAPAQHKHPAEESVPVSDINKPNVTELVTDSPAATAKEFTVNGKKIPVPDVWLVNQDGKKVRLYRDLIKDKTVAISFIYTRCTYVCPMNGVLFSKIQTELGERLGKEVFLISISMDPIADTPQALTKWGSSFDRKAGWSLLTGSLDEISKVLKVFTGDAPGPRESHPSFFYIANDKSGKAEFMFSHMSANSIVKKIDALRQQTPD